MLKDLISKVKSNDDKPGETPAPPKEKPAVDGQSPAPNTSGEALKEGEKPAVDGQSPAPNATSGEAPKEDEKPVVDGQSPAPNATSGEAPKEGEKPVVDGQSPAPNTSGEAPKEGEKPAVNGQSSSDQEGLAESTGTVSDSGTMKTISRESASMLNLLMEQIKALVEIGNNLNERTKESEKRINEITVETQKYKDELKQFSEKMEIMEKNMEKFIGLYEVVTNQYNPFLESSGKSSEEEETPKQEPANPQPAPVDNAVENKDAQFVVEDKISGQVTEASAEGSTNVTSANQANTAQPSTQKEQPHEKNVSQPLTLSDGKSVSNLQDLFEELVYMDDNTFRYHVSDTKHDIADWVEKSMGNKELADKLKTLKTRSGLIKGVSDFIHSLPPEGPTSSDFVLPDGKSVNDLEGLLDELIYLDDTQFGKLVTPDKNPIADWILNILKNEKLGTALKPLRTKSDIIKIIIQELHSQNK